LYEYGEFSQKKNSAFLENFESIKEKISARESFLELYQDKIIKVFFFYSYWKLKMI
jgi:hypothetical protein